jgi:hypothetical protein
MAVGPSKALKAYRKYTSENFEADTHELMLVTLVVM